MRNTALTCVLVATLFSCMISAAWGKTIYVKQGAAGGNNGTSWADAFTKLNSALENARPGDEIWVAAATYKPTKGTDRTISFVLPEDVAIYGGFAGTETERSQRDWASRVTTLNGNIGSTTTPLDNSYHVVIGASLATLDGFTVKNGRADSSVSSSKSGAGLYCDGATTMSLVNCTFSDNTATSCGGAIYNTGDAQTIMNCRFLNNSVISDSVFKIGHSPTGYIGCGGALYNSGHSLKIINAVFNGNSVDADFASGGAVHNYGTSPTLIGCAFNNNIVSGRLVYHAGGGLYNWSNGLTMSGCTLRGNKAFGGSGYGRGGAVSNYGKSGTITNCKIIENSADDVGGIDSSGELQTISVCDFIGNSATFGDGALSMAGSVENCTFIGNSVERVSAIASGGAAGAATVVGGPVSHCVFIQNSSIRCGGALYSDAIVTYCSFLNNYTTGTLPENQLSMGGAICGAKKIANCVFRGNMAQMAGAVTNGYKGMESIENCVFVQNRATSDRGGAIVSYQSEIAVSNCVFTGNSAQNSGGAIGNTIWGGAAQLVNCSFTGNSAGQNGGALHASGAATNCLFWENSAPQGGADIYSSKGLVKTSFCDLADWDGVNWNPNFGTDGGGNIKANPLWVSAANPAGPDGLYMTWDDGLRLQTGSPCIDAGYTVVAPPKDILGIPREGAADIGAYEFITPRNAARGWVIYE
ncbi:hypothetical protein LLG95_05590 [bacterium]|nr:hypothetical protein [bacterium]